MSVDQLDRAPRAGVVYQRRIASDGPGLDTVLDISKHIVKSEPGKFARLKSVHADGRQSDFHLVSALEAS